MPDNLAKSRQVDAPAGGAPPLGEEYHRAVLESISDIVAVVTASYTFRYVSPAVERVLGHTVAEVVGRPLREFIHPDDGAFLEARTASRLRGESDPDRFTEVRFRHRDGSWRILQVRGRRHDPVSGAPEVVVTARDVTEERRLEAQRDWLRTREREIGTALAHREQELRVLIDGSPDVIASYDRDLRHCLVSPAIARTGFPPEAFLGRTHMEIAAQYGILEPFATIWTEALTRARDTGREEIIFYSFPHPDGTQCWEARIAPLCSRDGRVERLMAVARDVTAQRAAELALRESESQLRQAQKLESIGRLAGGVAHDFNNLLNVISGLVYLALLNLSDESEARRDLLEVSATVRHAASLTQQLLAFSRRQVLQLKVLDLSDEVRKTSTLLRRIIEEDIELVTMLRSRGAVEADANQLCQVLMNLVVNARDAMPEGGKLTIETRDVELGEAESGNYVELLVRDTGRGMDESTLEQIFEPFFTTKGPEEGTGLGLSTVYGIVKQCGGYLRVDSAPGEGATFRIYLPRVTLQPEEAPPPRRVLPRARGEAILVIDDEPAVRTVTTRILQRSGYHVVAASGGAEALRLVEEYVGRLDLVLTDIVMPGTSGTELAERILERDPGLRIMYMSGYTDDQVLRRGVCRDEVHFLQKPFEAVELVQRVQEALARP